MKTTLILTLLFGILGTSGLARAEEIQIGDIGSKVIIIGKLGKPLGTMATIDGQMISEPKRGTSGHFTAAFRVNKVDGRPLAKGQIIGLIFRSSIQTAPAHSHDIVQLRGYESGAFVGTPDSARDSLGADASPLDWKFEPTFYAIKAQVVEPQQQ